MFVFIFTIILSKLVKIVLSKIDESDVFAIGISTTFSIVFLLIIRYNTKKLYSILDPKIQKKIVL
jgi:hypothetical protein